MTTANATLPQVEAEWKTKTDELHALLEKGGKDLDLTVEQVDEIRRRNDELNTLGERRAALRAVANILADNNARQTEQRASATAPTFPGGSGGTEKSATATFAGQIAATIKARREFGQTGSKQRGMLPGGTELKTLFQRSAGWTPETTRNGVVVPFATRPIELIDMIPTRPTTQTSIKYMEVTTFTNAAAGTAEAAAYPEGALALTERSSLVEKISVHLPVTDEQLEDVGGIEEWLTAQLRFMIRQKFEGDFLTGNGTTPNLRGLLNVSGIQTQAKGADPTPDTFYKAMTKIMTTGASTPDMGVMHPNDWQEVRLLRTADGIYIWGAPSDSAPARMWGLPVALAQALTEGTGVVGAFEQYSEIALRQDVETEISNSNNDDFTKGRQTIRADLRAAVTFYRPAAFCTLTGI